MITLCLPTKDRPAFLSRLLHYYASTNYQHWICIGDSSGPDQAAQNQQIVASLQDRLKISYTACPGQTACAAIETISRAISTPYFACIADDDFLCTRGLERCAAFLDAHPAYGAAHGLGILLMIGAAGPHGPVVAITPYQQAVLEAQTGSQRLQEYMNPSPLTVIFSVHRTAHCRAMFEVVTSLKGSKRNLFKDELIPSGVAAIRGKVKELDGLYLVRHVHDEIVRQPSVYEWLTSPDWFPSFEVYREHLIEELKRQDGLSADEAAQVITQAFLPYLAEGLAVSWIKYRGAQSSRANGSATALFRQAARRIPGLRRLKQRVRAMRALRSRDAWGLPALLNPGSPYHEDFLPVYRAITVAPAERVEEAVAA